MEKSEALRDALARVVSEVIETNAPEPRCEIHLHVNANVINVVHGDLVQHPRDDQTTACDDSE